MTDPADEGFILPGHSLVFLAFVPLKALATLMPSFAAANAAVFNHGLVCFWCNLPGTYHMPYAHSLFFSSFGRWKTPLLLVYIEYCFFWTHP